MRLAVSCASPDTTGLVAPIYAYPHISPGWAIVGGPVYHAPAGAESPYPASYEGTIFAGDTWRSLVKHIVPSGPGWALAAAVPGQADPENWETGAAWITHLEVGPDGSLWYTSLETATGGPGEVRRILYYPPSVGVPASPAGDDVRLLAPHPSPTRGAITIAWSLPAPARVEVALLDARGRAVRKLVRSGGRLSPAGAGAAQWDGLDDCGRAAPPGVYFVRLTAGAVERRERLVFLR